MKLLKRSLCYLLFTIFLLAGNACKSDQKESKDFESFSVKRGTNIAHFLSQSDRRGAERAAFFTEEDVKLIASLGFDHIRLPIDEMQMWDEDMNRNKDAFELLNNTIQWCADAGLRVIVDLHILRSHHFNHGEKPLWTERAEQEKFFNMWKDLSSELKKYPNGQVAYEIMNEAVTDDPDNWNNLMNEAVRVIREEEPERTIVVGSNMWQSVDTFDDLLIPENDQNLLLSFHFYLPFALTHHQASWTGIKDYDGPVKYPGEVVEEEDLEGYPEELVNQVLGGAGYWDIDELKAKMKEPVAYAKKHGLPLYCGEFGVYRPAPYEDAMQWYEDMIKVLEEQDIAWANWCYKGSFGIFGEDGNPDPILMQKLFQNMETE